MCHPPILPVGLQNQVDAFAFTYVDRVVVYRRIADRSGDVDPAVMIVLADVITHDGVDISDVFTRIVTSFIAYEQEAAVVVMAVVVLDASPARVPRHDATSYKDLKVAGGDALPWAHH